MQAWLERKRLRDIKARAAAVSALTREAHHLHHPHQHQPQTRSSLADTETEANAKTKIFINPRDLVAEEEGEGEGEVEGSSSGGILVRAPVSILELQTKVSEVFPITEKAYFLGFPG